MSDRELRIAPVMTGGTSLAVWMGGVTTELYTMVRSPDDAPDGVYARLLAMTRTTPRVDVITGTSAGGLNGVLLAAACHLGVPAAAFTRLRDTWMEVADLRALLRSPRDPNPPSLLRGDDDFVRNVQELLDRWIEATSTTVPPEPLPEPAPDLDLVTTVTTLRAEPIHRVDDFDEEIDEVSHAQTLRFRSTHFEDDDWPARLAIAARTSASIPGVFEPSYLPIGSDHARASGRPSFEDNASFRHSRWAIDGGVVVNLPLTEALDRIFDRGATTEVRRVALYVAPTPSEATVADADKVGAEPTIRESVLAAVLAPRAEGVSSDIDELRRQNATVERQARARAVLGPTVEILLDPTHDAAAPTFELFKERRAAESVAATIAALRRSLPYAGQAVDARLTAALMAARLDLFPAGPAEFERQVAGRTLPWAWGIRPVEQALSIVIRLLARAHHLVPPAGPDEEQPATAAGLAAAQEQAYEQLDRLQAIRAKDDAFWRERYARLVEEDTRPSSQDLEAWATRAYHQWLVAPPPDDADAPTEPVEEFGQLLAIHRQVAQILIDVAPTLRELSGPAASLDGAGAEPAQIHQELSVLGLGEAGIRARTKAARVTQVQQRLLALHVAQTAVLGEVIDREQPIELMQVSFNSRNLLDPDRKPADKLAGPELGRLGAFLKPSWRANDWCWGRMDGAYRLVLLLADPQQLRRLYPTAEAALPKVAECCGLSRHNDLPPDIIAEVRSLWEPGADRVRSMPKLAAHLARERQTEIAVEELPRVAEAVEQSQGNESESGRFLGAYQAALVDKKVPPDRAAELVQRMRIGTETVRTELGFPALNDVIARTASVAVNALTGNRSGLSILARVLRPLRGPFQAVSSLVSVVVGDSPLARAATIFVLAVAGAIVSVRLVGIDVPAGSFGISAILLIGLVVAAMLRSGAWWLALAVLVGGTTVGLAVAGPDDLKTVFYDSHEPTSTEVLRHPTATLDHDATIRVTRGTGGAERIQDIEVPSGATIVIRGSTAFTEEADRQQGVAGWKRWGFLAEPLSIFRVATGLMALALLVRTVLWGGRMSNFRRAGRLLLAAGLGVAAWGSNAIFTPVLTGASGTTAWKDDMVTVAGHLHGYSLEVTLAVIVGASVVLALGTDLFFSRQARRFARWVRREWAAGTRRLRRAIGADQ